MKLCILFLFNACWLTSGQRYDVLNSLPLNSLPVGEVPKDIKNILSYPVDYFKNVILSHLPSTTDTADDSKLCEEKVWKLITSFSLSNSSEESIQFIDALGKPPSGVLNGNTIFMGSYDSCKTMEATAGYGSDYKSCKIKAVMTLKKKASTPITWTVCFPKECRDGNFTALKEGILEIVNKDPNVLYISEESVVTTCNEAHPYDIGAYCAILLLSVILVLVIVGTSWEPVAMMITLLKSAEDRKVLVNDADDNIGVDEIVADDVPESVQHSKPDPARTSHIGEMFKCFSLQRTFGALLNTTTKPGQILCLNGIRVMSINWVVLGHVYYIGMGAADYTDYIQMWRKNAMAIIYNALPAVDTFLFLSGFLVSLLLSKDLARKGRFNAVGYYLHRYLRLTVPFLVVTLGQGFLAHIYIRGPFEDILKPGHRSCEKYWWTNILYINNIVPWNKVQICIAQTWYLSNDFQFFVFAPLFVWLLYKTPRTGVIVTCITAGCSCIAAGVITYSYNLGPSTVFDPTGNFTDFKLLYDKPWIRCPPYLIGILGGWFCFKHIDSLKLYISRLSYVTKLLLVSILWIVTCTVQYWVVFGLHRDMLKKTVAEELNLAESVLYESLARSSWAIALFIQILACQCGLGGVVNKVLSWKGWIVLSRLTFAVYLLHYIIIQSFVVQLRHPFFFRPDYEIAILYLGFLGMSYAASALFFACVEQPLAFIERMTYRR